MVKYRWSIAGGIVADCRQKGNCSDGDCFAQGAILDLTQEQFRNGGQVGLSTEVYLVPTDRSAPNLVGELAVGTVELKPAGDPDRRSSAITSMQDAVGQLRSNGGCLVKLAQAARNQA